MGAGKAGFDPRGRKLVRYDDLYDTKPESIVAGTDTSVNVKDSVVMGNGYVGTDTDVEVDETKALSWAGY